MTGVSQKFQRRMLRTLLAVALGLLLWGLIRLWMDGIGHHAALAEFARLDTIAHFLRAILRAEPVALLAAGMALVAVTPALRLLLLFIDFAAQRDALYAVICVVVGAVIVVGGVIRLP
ncbi:MAG: DUF1634 domain-containing protein [Phycisphaerae bacterium]|nr:DUF1634 domain-containing protein [Phycisphaerae bacterium]